MVLKICPKRISWRHTITPPSIGYGISTSAAPPMTFEVGGKQYVAIQSGLNRNALNINSMTPELREMRNQTMLFVFGL